MPLKLEFNKFINKLPNFTLKEEALEKRIPIFVLSFVISSLVLVSMYATVTRIAATIACPLPTTVTSQVILTPGDPGTTDNIIDCSSLDITVTSTGEIVVESYITDDSSLNGDSGVVLLVKSLTVDPGGKVTADGQGYQPGDDESGTGIPVDASGTTGGSGGGFGGAGGEGVQDAINPPETPGTTYGNKENPIHLGSPGGASGDAGQGGAGGGALKIEATGSVVINGELTANGADGQAAGAASGGGGSGGSIWIEADEIDGSGTISANGGSSVEQGNQGGGGGGGRVIVFCDTTNSFTGSVNAAGGITSNSQNGAVGTVLGPTCRPNEPTVLKQIEEYTQSGVQRNILNVGDATSKSKVVLAADMNDVDNLDTLSLQIEVRPLSESFTNVPNFTQTPDASNPQLCVSEFYSDCGFVLLNEGTNLLTSTEYHWQVRVRDDKGGFSDWVAYGANAEAERDFLLAGNPTKIVVVSGNNQSGTVNTTLGSAMVARVEDANGFEVPDIPVRWSVTDGNGSVANTDTFNSDRNGEASNTHTLGTVSGNNEILVEHIGAYSVTPTSFSHTGIADAAVTFDFITPLNARSNLDFSVTVRAKDQFDNIATGYTGTPIFTPRDASDPNIDLEVSEGWSLIPDDTTFSSGDQGQKVLNFQYNNEPDSILIKADDGSINGLSDQILISDVGDCFGFANDAALSPITLSKDDPWVVDAGSTTGGIIDCSNVHVILEGGAPGANVVLQSYDSGDQDWLNDYGITLLAKDLTVEPGAKINADLAGYGNVDSWNVRGPGGGSGGASHGGYGTGNSLEPYGDVYEPIALGSKGPNCSKGGNVRYGGDGGGAIRLVVENTFTIDGEVTSDGAPANSTSLCTPGQGSGGSIWIETSTIASTLGNGLVTANAGDGIGSGAGGGRVSLYYENNSGFNLDVDHVQVRGSTNGGGPGTFYLENTSSDQEHKGKLFSDNNDNNKLRAAIVEGTYEFREIELTGYGHVNVLGDSSVLIIPNGNALVGDTTIPELVVYGTLQSPSYLRLSGVDLGLRGDKKDVGGNGNGVLNVNIGLECTLGEYVDQAVCENNGGSWNTTITRGGFILYEHTWAHNSLANRFNFETVNTGPSSTIEFRFGSVDGNYGQHAQFEFDKLDIYDGAQAIINRFDNGDQTWENDYGVEIIADDLNVRSGGTITADSRGYGVSSYGSSTKGPGSGSGGSAYGGYNANNTIAPFGDVYEPYHLGSRGIDCSKNGNTRNGGMGGGAIRLTISGDLTLDGEVTSDGATASSTSLCSPSQGTGGSIWIDTDNLISTTGDGLITANAGDNIGTGSAGGRVALYYNNNSGFNLDVDHVQSRSSGNGGGPGTVYYEHKGVHPARGGEIFVDNNNNSKTRAGIEEGTYQFTKVELTKYGHLDVLGNNSILTVTDSNGLVGDSTIPELRLFGTFRSPDYMKISGVDVALRGAKEDIGGGGNGLQDVNIGVACSVGEYMTQAECESNSGTWDTGLIRGGLTLYEHTWAHNTLLGHFIFNDINLGPTSTFEILFGDESVNYGQHAIVQVSDLDIYNGAKTIINRFDNGDQDWTNDYGVQIKADNINVRTGAEITADLRGYGVASYGSSTKGPGSGSGGTSYGGYNSSETRAPFGDAYEPYHLGSRGIDCSYKGNSRTGGMGGGAMRLSVTGTLTIDGEITSDGGSANSTSLCSPSQGTGGSIWINTGGLESTTGDGLITANAGDGIGSGAAGGRIAVYYTNNSGFNIDVDHIQSRSSGNGGGPGTAYVENKSTQSNQAGDLYVDNRGLNLSKAGLEEGTYEFEKVELTRYGHLDVLGDNSIIKVTDGNGLVGDSTIPELTIYGTIQAPEYFRISGVDVGLRGAKEGLSGGDGLVNVNVGVACTVGEYMNQTDCESNGGTWDTTILRGGLTLYEHTWAHNTLVNHFNFQDVNIGPTSTLEFRFGEVAGDYGQHAQFEFDTLDLYPNSIAIINRFDNGDQDWTNDYGVELITDNLRVQSAAKIDADLRGYGVSSYGSSTKGPGSTSTGTTYGGYGYSTSLLPFGDVYEPDTIGSRGKDCSKNGNTRRGGMGGGAIKLTNSGNLELYGEITSDGGSASSTSLCSPAQGTGGSIWIDTNTLTSDGNGLITTNAGDNIGYGAAGGRIAVYFNTNNGFNVDVSHLQSRSSGNGGGPGTVYVEDKSTHPARGGLLFVNNDNNNKSPAGLPEGDYAFENIELTGYGHLDVLGNASTLTVTDPNSLNGDTTIPELVVFGTFRSPNYIKVSGLDLGIRGAKEDIGGGGTGFRNVNIGMQCSTGEYMTQVDCENNSGTWDTSITRGGLILYEHTWAHNTLANRFVLEDVNVGPSSTLEFRFGSVAGNYGQHAQFEFSDIDLYNGASAIINRYDSDDQDFTNDYGVEVIADSLNVQSGATVTADLRGYGVSSYGSTVKGPGGNAPSYGGYGASGVKPFGSIEEPVTLGTRGVDCSKNGNTRNGGMGGGAMKLSIAGLLNIDGEITSDGGPANSTSLCSPAKGTGGSVWIDTDVIAGSGTISANAGSGLGSYAGGGRIAVYSNSSTFPLDTNVTATGGDGGGAGTVYILNREDHPTDGTLILDNNGVNGLYSQDFDAQLYNFYDVYIRDGAKSYLTSNPDVLPDNAEFPNVPRVGDGNEPVLESSVVGLWTMNEGIEDTCLGGINDICDSSTNVNDGAFAGAAAVFDSTGPVHGTSSVYVPATSGGDIQIPDSDSLDVIDAYTMEAWVKINSARDYHVVAQKDGGYSGNGVYGIRIDGANRPYNMIAWGSGNGQGGSVSSTEAMTVGQWHYIVATYDKSELNIYLDGELTGTSSAYTDSLFASSGDLSIGEGDGRRADMYLDSLVLHNVALTSTQIHDRYYSQKYGVTEAEYNQAVSDFQDAFGARIGAGPVFDLSGDFHLGSGSLLDGSGKGFPPGEGAGKGIDGAGQSGGGGAGHGGTGGDGESDGGNPAALGGAFYGSQREPLTIGSGGGMSGAGASGGNGGGAVAIYALEGNVNIEGTITVNGTDGLIASPGGGGGAGGSILVASQTCDISGSLSATGGDGGDEAFDGGGGGGGRLSLLFTDTECNAPDYDTSVERDAAVAQGTSPGGTTGQVGTFPASISIPSAPDTKDQFETDDVTAIPVGGFTQNNAVILKASLFDPDPGITPSSVRRLRAEFEVVLIGDEFTGTGPNVRQGPVEQFDGSSPIITKINATGLVKGQDYKWRVRAENVDDGIFSEWVEFGNNSTSSADFRVSTAEALTIDTDKTDVLVGETITLTVDARDAGNSVDPSYRGTTMFSSTAATVILPANYSYSAGDAGTHEFTDELIFLEAGTFTVTVVDQLDPALTDTTVDITVTAPTPTDTPVPTSGPTATPGPTPTGVVASPVPTTKGEPSCHEDPLQGKCLVPVDIFNVRVEVADSNDQARICWDTNIETKGNIDYGLNNPGIYTDSTDIELEYKVTDHCQTLTNLTEDSAYIFRITATAPTSLFDTYESAFSTGAEIVEVTPVACIDIEPNSYVLNDQNTVELRFETAASANCRATYGSSSDNLDYSVSEEGLLTSHSLKMNLDNIDASDLVYKVECSVELGETSGEYTSCEANGVIPLFKLPETGEVESVLGIPWWLPLLPFTGLGLANLLSYPRWLLYALAWVKDRKKDKAWGVVYNADKNNPVMFASVKLYQGSKFIKEKVTGREGKYGFVANQGKYKLIVDHPDFDTYVEDIEVAEKEGIVARDIGLRQRKSEGENNRQIDKNWREKLRENLSKLNSVIVAVGFILSVVITIISPSLFNFLVVTFYVVQFIVLFILSLRSKKNWGYVYNSNNNKRIPGAFVRVYDNEETRQVDVQMTDDEGRYGFMVKEGKYDLSASKRGYKFTGKDMKGIVEKHGSKYLELDIQKGKAVDKSIGLEPSGKESDEDNSSAFLS